MIEEKLAVIVDEMEERSEQNGFLTEEDTTEFRGRVTELLSSLVTQERTRDAILIERQVKIEAEETSESFDALASVVNEYFLLRQDLIKVEAEVFEFARILQSMPRARADKFKAKLWLAWYDMQKTLKIFS